MGKRKKSEKVFFIIFFLTFFLLNTQFSNSLLGYVRWAVLILYALYNFINAKLSFDVVKHSGVIWFAIAIFPSVFSILSSTYALSRLISLFLTLIMFALLVNNRNCNKEYLQQIFNWFVDTVLVFVLANAIFIFVPAAYYFGRFRGFFTNANGCAYMALFAMICVLYCMYTRRKKKMYACIFLVCAVIVVLTQSRMAFVLAALVLSVSPIVLVKKRTLGSRTWAVVLVMGIVLGALIVIPKFDLGVVDRLALTDGGRSAWEYAYSRIAIKPAFGHGYSFSAYARSITGSEEWVFFSSYLEFIVDCGYFGMSVIGLFFVARLIKFAKVLKRVPDIKIFALFIVAGLSFAVTESFLFAVGNPLSVCFWFVFILATKYASLKE